MINNIDGTQFRVAEYIQLHTNILQVIESNDPSELKVLSQTSAHERAVAALDLEYKRHTSSSITKILAELDERRDNAFAGILRVISGFELHFELAKRDAARRVSLIFSKYGSGVTRLRYQQETGEIRSLVGDLQGDEAAMADIQLMGLTAWVEELRVANEEFDKHYVLRAQEMAGESSQVSALRAAVQEKWEELAAHLTAHATITPSAKYTKTVAELNRLITNYKDATNRSGKIAVTPPVPIPPITDKI